MIRNNRWFKIAGITFLALFIISTVAYGIGNTLESSKDKPDSDLKVQSDEMDKQLADKDKLVLLKEKVLQLYNEGYGLVDIEKAEELAQKYDKAPEEILQIKGKTSFGADKTGNSQESAAVKENGVPWSEVELELHMKKALEKSGATDEDKAAIEKNFQDRRDSFTNNGNPDANKKITSDADLMKRYKITDQEKELCKKSGIASDMEIIRAKGLAVSSNTTLEKVLDIKKNKTNWRDVEDELGGGK